MKKGLHVGDEDHNRKSNHEKVMNCKTNVYHHTPTYAGILVGVGAAYCPFEYLASIASRISFNDFPS